MKKTALLLCVLMSSGFAQTSLNSNYLDGLVKDLSNPSLYKEHNLVITKEVQHKFLFFPYTKEEVVNKISFSGVSGIMVNETSIPYVNGVSKSINGETIITNDVLKTGLSVSISKLSENKQVLTLSQKELISLKDFTSNDLTIQLPTFNETSFSLPITEDSFIKTWSDSSGQIYHLRYSGEKSVLKS